jgi:CBS domain containing-hemolysin-like protein
MGVLLLVVFLTIFISFQCSLYEATLYSTRMGALESAKGKKKQRDAALRMIRLKRDISVPISAILILNTLANTAGATIAGMYAHKVLGTVLVPLFSIVFTLAILFLAEIMPKTLGAVSWRHVWPLIVLPLQIISRLLYPAIVVTRAFSNLMTRGKTPPPVSEEEILGVIRLGAREGEISYLESRMLHNIIELENKPVREIMTPRTVMFVLDADQTVENALQAFTTAGFSRIPVFEGDKDNVIGYVMIHDLSSAKALSSPDTPVRSIVRPISFVREDANCLSLLTEFLKRRSHISIVQDEYASLRGVVTLEDLLETVLGMEIVDETDRVADLQKLARKRTGPAKKSKKSPPAKENSNE